MGSSYAALTELCENILDSNMISKALPANLAFVALIGHGMLDRYPDLRIGFLEFGGEWIFYMSGRLKHYAALNRRRMPNSKGILQRDVDDYLNQAEFSSPRRRMMPCWFKRWRSWVRIRSCSPRTFPTTRGAAMPCAKSWTVTTFPQARKKDPLRQHFAILWAT